MFVTNCLLLIFFSLSDIPRVHKACFRVYHSPLFVENIFCKCFISCSKTIEYLKCNFRVKNIFPIVPSRGVKVKNIDISKCSKVCLVGTLNLCLEMPDAMKKVWAQLDHPGRRKRPKCAKILAIS